MNKWKQIVHITLCQGYHFEIQQPLGVNTSPTIRVLIPLKLTVFSCEQIALNEQNKQKDGQRAHLLLQRFEFESHWSIEFLPQTSFEKNKNKQKDAVIIPRKYVDQAGPSRNLTGKGIQARWRFVLIPMSVLNRPVTR